MATEAKLNVTSVRSLLATFILWLPLHALALDSKPHVLVRMDINAPAFVRNLPQRLLAEEVVSKQLAEQLKQRYAFADWPIATLTSAAPSNPSLANESRLGTLVLRLEEDRSTVPNPSIVLRWYAGAESSAALRPLALAPIEIYEPSNPNWDTNNRRDFETRVTSKLNAAMRSDAFFAAFFQNFIRTLSIASSVRPQKSERVVDLPMQWRDMLLAPESVIIVRFKKKQGTVAEQGSLRLSPVSARVIAKTPSAQGITMLRGSVDQASFAAQPLSLVANWNNRLPELLRDAEIRCYIFDYKPLEFVGTADGLVLDTLE